MEVEVVIKADIEDAEKKINSKKYFDAEEAAELVNELFARFLQANIFLQSSILAIFKLKKGIDFIENDNDKALEKEFRTLSTEYENLLGAAIEGNNVIMYKGKFNELNQKIEEIAAQAKVKADFRERILNDSKKILDRIGVDTETARINFNAELKKMHSEVKWNVFGIYLLSFGIAVFVDFSVRDLKLERFNSLFDIILQVAVIFLINEFFINRGVKFVSRCSHLPNLKNAVNTLKKEFDKYDSEMERVCADAGIEKKYLFYEIDKIYDFLKNRENRTI